MVRRDLCKVGLTVRGSARCRPLGVGAAMHPAIDASLDPVGDHPDLLVDVPILQAKLGLGEVEGLESIFINDRVARVSGLRLPAILGLEASSPLDGGARVELLNLGLELLAGLLRPAFVNDSREGLTELVL